MPAPETALRGLLKSLVIARASLAAATESEQKIPILAKALAKRMPELSDAALVNAPEFPGTTTLDPQVLNRLIHETPEQREIERIRAERVKAEAAILELRARVRTVWMHLAGEVPANKPALELYDLLSPYPTIENTDAMIGLMKAVLQPANAKMRRGRGAIEAVKVRIRELKAARLTHEQICAELGNSARPPNADWRNLPWPEAWKRQHSAVAKWISKITPD